MQDCETTSDVWCEAHQRFLIEVIRGGKYDGEYCPECDRESREE
ncbi:hypothetical protein LCGC14_2445610 [marine sediment metagenome]|uniref:Uncharacterized protein n=1 Tax=marine sediment metagenome TaxID=412755 RepID=A0A0F9DUT2_9ZZZZ